MRIQYSTSSFDQGDLVARGHRGGYNSGIGAHFPEPRRGRRLARTPLWGFDSNVFATHNLSNPSNSSSRPNPHIPTIFDRDREEERQTESLLEAYNDAKARERHLRGELEETLNRRESLATYEFERAKEALEEIRNLRQQMQTPDTRMADERDDAYGDQEHYLATSANPRRNLFSTANSSTNVDEDSVFSFNTHFSDHRNPTPVTILATNPSPTLDSPRVGVESYANGHADPWRWFNSEIRGISESKFPLEATMMTQGCADQRGDRARDSVESKPGSPSPDFNYLAMKDDMTESIFTYEAEDDGACSVDEDESSRHRSLGSLASSVNGDHGDMYGDIIQDHQIHNPDTPRLPWDLMVRSTLMQSTAMLRESILGPMNSMTPPPIDMGSIRGAVVTGDTKYAEGLPPLVAVKRESLMILLKAFDQILLHEYS